MKLRYVALFLFFAFLAIEIALFQLEERIMLIWSLKLSSALLIIFLFYTILRHEIKVISSTFMKIEQRFEEVENRFERVEKAFEKIEKKLEEELVELRKEVYDLAKVEKIFGNALKRKR